MAARLAQEAGADYVGTDEYVTKIQEGWMDFDVAVAVPQVMGKIGRLGRVLGSRGLMPNPKAGTIVQPEDIPNTIRQLRQGRVEFRMDRTRQPAYPHRQGQLYARAVDDQLVGRDGRCVARQAYDRQGAVHRARHA